MGVNGADYYLAYTGKLPDYYVTKSDTENSSGGKILGGDVYENRNEHLPDAPGRIWYEADINYVGGPRGGERIVYSSDGLIFVTYDNYRTFIEVINPIKISDKQLGKKVGKHATDYGLNPTDPASRNWIKNKINDIFNSPDEIREGTFSGQGNILTSGSNARGDVKFYIQGNDVVITDMNNNFATILKDRINNQSAMNGTKIWT
ncbi:MAG: hypothetical protein FWD71_03285 [Oscillospiraceae bacterium]|nr:hypothetical protein [Oscillospiraceae bacterium]